ncbi:M48 family metallopeptidase [Sphingomonas sp. HDW15A]|nr:M48 family metallopeptidase [Sphingomonas sp. HDW15A]
MKWMPANSSGTLSIVRSDLLDDGETWPWPLELRVDRRARRLRLRIDADRRRVVLTCPPRASRRAALEWANGQRDWAKGAIARIPKWNPIVPGATIPFDGREVALNWEPAEPRTPALRGGTLVCGGPIESFEARILRWLRAEALERLSGETAAAAFFAGVTVSSVRVGDAGTRWGSCSSAGAIRYNWRLVMAPPHVRQWVVAHEVAHRVHMNHGNAFKELEARIYGGDGAAARLELRRISARLKGSGADCERGCCCRTGCSRGCTGARWGGGGGLLKMRSSSVWSGPR